MQNRIHLYSWQETGEEDVDNSDVGELTISSHYRQCAATEGEGEARAAPKFSGQWRVACGGWRTTYCLQL